MRQDRVLRAKCLLCVRGWTAIHSDATLGDRGHPTGLAWLAWQGAARRGAAGEASGYVKDSLVIEHVGEGGEGIGWRKNERHLPTWHSFTFNGTASDIDW